MAHFENKYTHKSVAIDDSGRSELGRKFAAEQAQAAAERQAAGYLKPTAVLSTVGVLTADLLGRGMPRDRVIVETAHLADAGWKLPADEWLRLAADTWRDVLREASASGAA